MGNSEVGHLNIGAGRVVYQDLTRITKSISDGDFFENPRAQARLRHGSRSPGDVPSHGPRLGGRVHSDLGHLKACLDMARRERVADVVVHAFLDGRDTPPDSSPRFLADVEAHMRAIGVGRYGTVAGRYYAMDRDDRWERVGLAYEALVYGAGFVAPDAQAAVAAAAARGETDEFVRPTVIGARDEHRVRDGDVCLFFNFRPDRARELTRAFFEDPFAASTAAPTRPGSSS